MGKKKNIHKKFGLSDRVANKKKNVSEKINPFELHINKQKFNVMGKMRKFEKGLRGVSRSKATQIRKETLLKEYGQRNKSNKFIDRRIGEYDKSMSKEDKMLARFAKERQRLYDKSSKRFNLNDEDEFLPYGQSLADIDKLAYKRADSDDDDDNITEKIAADIVSSGHFGGGPLNENRDEAGGEENTRKSHKDFMEELIARSKQEKLARQLEKERTKDLTEKLDLEWKNLSTEFGIGLKGRKDIPSTPADDYDILVKQLMFEAKAVATTRLKTEEELAMEAKLKLEKLEVDRILRMKGLDEDKSKPVVYHRSADDLDDGFILDKSDERIPLCYNLDGDMMLPEKSKLELKGILKKLNERKIERSKIHVNKSKDEEESESNNEEDEDIEESEDESEEEDEVKEEEDMNEEETEAEEEDEGEDEEEESVSDEEMQNIDYNSGRLINDYDDDKIENKDKILKSKDLCQQAIKKVKFQESKETEKKIFLEQLKRKKLSMESARKELPFTFAVPNSYDEFQKTLSGHDSDDQRIIIDRIIKCSHPSLDEGNKQKLERLFGFLLQHIYDQCDVDADTAFKVTDKMTSFLYSLAQFSPRSAGQCLLGIIKEKQGELEKERAKRAGRGSFPNLNVFIYLKLISVLLSTSDFHHTTVTPTMLYMSQLLTQCPVTKPRDIIAGIFLCNIFYEYVLFSKRYVPEAISFLYGLLLFSLPKASRKGFIIIPPFQNFEKSVFLEIANSKTSRQIEIKKLDLRMLSATTDLAVDDEFRVCVVNAALTLSLKFAELYDSLLSYKDIFYPFLKIIQLLPDANYPNQILDIKNLFMELLNKPVFYYSLVQQMKKPQGIPQLDPEIIINFDPIRNKFAKGSKSFKKSQKLKSKCKRELRGALREIRKDNQFIARERLKEKLTLDKERADKTKKILGFLKNQEGEVKSLKKSKFL